MDGTFARTQVEADSLGEDGTGGEEETGDGGTLEPTLLYSLASELLFKGWCMAELRFSSMLDDLWIVLIATACLSIALSGDWDWPYELDLGMPPPSPIAVDVGLGVKYSLAAKSGFGLFKGGFDLEATWPGPAAAVESML